MTTSPSTPQVDPMMQLLGSDPWMRFDLWSARAWDASEKAINVAAESDSSVNMDSGLDTRIITLFQASELAKEFAAVVNPLFAMSCMGHARENGTDEMADLERDILFDNEED